MGMLARRVRPVVRPAADVEPAGRVPGVHRQVPRRADPRARSAPTVTAPGGHPRNDDQDGAFSLAECRPSPSRVQSAAKSRKPLPTPATGTYLGLERGVNLG